MRTLSMILATGALALGCAPRPSVNTAAVSWEQRLTVTLHPPADGMYRYTLSEPAYVAIFAVSRGRGVSLAFPSFESQAGYRGRAGLNMEPPQGAGLFVMPRVPSEDKQRLRSFSGYTDAYYILASREPLPLEEILESPYFLRSLLGADLFRATDLSRTRAALEHALVRDLRNEDWASAVYFTVRSPFQLAAADERNAWNPLRAPWSW